MARWCFARLIGFAKRSGSRFASLTLRRARSCPHVRDSGRRAGCPAVLPARHIATMLGTVLFRQFVGRNAEADHQVVEIHHHVAHLFHKMPAHLRLLQPLLSDDVSDLPGLVHHPQQQMHPILRAELFPFFAVFSAKLSLNRLHFLKTHVDSPPIRFFDLFCYCILFSRNPAIQKAEETHFNRVSSAFAMTFTARRRSCPYPG